MHEVPDRGAAIQSRDRNQLIEQYRDYVHYIVGKMVTTLGLPVDYADEFISAGYLGLVEAARRFDFDAGTDFSSFAYLRIRGAVIDNIRKNSDLSGKQYRYARAVQGAQELRVEEQASGEFSSSEDAEGALAQLLDFAAKGAIAFRLSVADVESEVSLREPTSDPEALFLAGEDSSVFRELVETLPEKERLIIEEYYFNDKSFAEIVDEHQEFSKSWVSRLHARALEQLKVLYLKRMEEGSLP